MTRDVRRVPENKNRYLFFFMMIDYIFTFIGIELYGIIEEANPLLIWLFEKPFIVGFSIRLFYCLIIYGLFEFIYKSEYEHYNILINSMILINVIVIVMHLNWTKVLLNLVLS